MDILLNLEQKIILNQWLGYKRSEGIFEIGTIKERLSAITIFLKNPQIQKAQRRDELYNRIKELSEELDRLWQGKKTQDTLNEIVSSDLNEILSEYPTKGILVIY